MKEMLTMKSAQTNAANRIRQSIADMLLSCRKAGTDRDSSDTSDSIPLGRGGLEISSLTLLQVFVKVEETLGFTFDDASVADAKFETVGDFVNFVMRAYDARITEG